MMSDGAIPIHYHKFSGDWQAVNEEVIEEGFLTLYVNGKELATLMCSPIEPVQLALGFLANEGFISSYSDVEIVHLCPAGSCVDIWLGHAAWDRPRRKIITSGCGGGLTFTELAAHQEPVGNSRLIEPGALAELINRLQSQNSLYARARGVHTSALSDGEKLLIVAEDIGRHNTLDRLRGECLRSGIDPHGLILLSTGRISSEMIHKSVQMGCEIVASRTSPTSMSVGLAQEWNITLCGYVRRNSMNVYTHRERLQGARFTHPAAGYLVAEFTAPINEA